MLIGIDASRAARAQRTGTENYAYQLIRHLLALDTSHHYRLYLPQPPPTGLFDSRAEVRVVSVPRLWTHIGLSWEMMRHAPDLLFVPAHVLPLVHPRRSVVTVHDLGYHHFPEAHTLWQRHYLEWSTRFALKHASRLIAVSQATKDDLIKIYGADERKVSVVYHGLIPPSPNPFPRSAAYFAVPEQGRVRVGVSRARFNLPQKYLIAIGTVQPRKNYARLIEAFSSLDLPRECVALVIVGKFGWGSAKIEAQAQRAGVVLTGHLREAEMFELLSGATMFVLPSLYEGFGMTILEAQAAGVPVITSHSSSCPEVAGEGALLVDPLDTHAIAEAIQRLWRDDALRQSLIRKGFENLQRFSWERCARETLSVLEEVEGDKGDRGD